jgi:hypothetical protein
MKRGGGEMQNSKAKSKATANRKRNKSQLIPVSLISGNILSKQQGFDSLIYGLTVFFTNL